MRKFINEKIKHNPIVTSSLGLVVITLLAKFIGYGEKVVLAYFFGTNYQVDVYMLIFTIITAIFLIFREIIEPGFLNTFLRLKKSGNTTSAWKLFNAVFIVIFGIVIIIVCIVIITPEGTTNLFAPGFTDDRRQLAITLIQIAVPATIFMSLSNLTSITLNGLKRFVYPASGDLVFKSLILITLCVLFSSMGIKAAVLGILLGAFGKLVMHLWGLRKHLYKGIAFEKKHLYTTWLLTWPLLLGVSFSQVSGIVDNIFASFLQEGAIAAIGYAKKVTELPILLFPYILSVVVFPYFSELSIEKNQERLKKLLGQTLKYILYGFVPLSVYIIIFAQPIVEVIFQHGAFDVKSTQLTQQPLIIYAYGLLFFAIEAIIVIFYFSTGDTKTPIFIGIACTLLNIAVTYILIKYIDYLGIPMAYVISKTIKVFILIFLINKKIKYRAVPIFRKVILVSIGALLAGIIMYLFNSIDGLFEYGFIIKALILGFIFIITGSFYFAFLYFTENHLLNRLNKTNK